MHIFIDDSGDGGFKFDSGSSSHLIMAACVFRDPLEIERLSASMKNCAAHNVKAVQGMLGHSSAAMTLDVYADLFDGDLDSVSDALDNAVSLASVGKMWANT